MNLIAWLLFGTVVGLVGYTLDTKGNENSLVSSVLLGMGGALLGGIISNTLFGFTLEQFDLYSFMIAMGGSLLLFVGGKTLQRI